MVTTQNGVRMTDMELRHAVEEIMERRGWTTNRVAAEIRSSEDKLVNWLEHSHVTAMTQFRAGLLEFVREWRSAPIASTPPETRGAAERGSAEIDEPDGFGEATPNAPIAETSPVLRSLPAGFEPIAPARSIASNTQPAGLSFSAAFDRATLSKELAAALGNPQRVLIAANPLTRELLVRAATADEGAAMKVSKGRDVSKSVAERAKAFGASKRFYPATETVDGTWRIKLAA